MDGGHPLLGEGGKHISFVSRSARVLCLSSFVAALPSPPLSPSSCVTDQQHAAVIYYNRIFPARNNEINPSVNGGGNGKAFKLTKPLPLSLSLSFAHLLCLIHSSANLLIIRGRLAIRYRQPFVVQIRISPVRNEEEEES